MVSALTGFLNLYQIEHYALTERFVGSNRMNQRGEALEYFIYDLFNNADSEAFSYLGNKNNPPDAILKGGDAIEIKKIENQYNNLALNSSFPKAFLYQDDPMLTPACRSCEGLDWIKKDMLYVIGTYPVKKPLQSLWFIYGDCWIADREIYQRIKQEVTKSIESCGLELSKTKELARVNRVDPLGITDLRVRGMWGIKNPSRVFDYLFLPKGDIFSAYFVMTEEKFSSFSIEDRAKLEEMSQVSDAKISFRDITIKSPNNPAKSIRAKVIYLCK